MRWIPVSVNINPPFHWLGRQPYDQMWLKLQQRAEGVSAGTQDEVVWACEHDPVYTTGRRGIDNRVQAGLDAPLIHTDRGGEATFHGPDQVMLYPVVSLRKHAISPRGYVHLLEQSCIDCLNEMGVSVSRREGLPGVWTGEGKIAAVGLRISQGVAYHGMALNVDVDAKWFAAINACGTGLSSVNLSANLGQILPLDFLAKAWAAHFVRLLGKASD